MLLKSIENPSIETSSLSSSTWIERNWGPRERKNRVRRGNGNWESVLFYDAAMDKTDREMMSSFTATKNMPCSVSESVHKWVLIELEREDSSLRIDLASKGKLHKPYDLLGKWTASSASIIQEKLQNISFSETVTSPEDAPTTFGCMKRKGSFGGLVSAKWEFYGTCSSLEIVRSHCACVSCVSRSCVASWL